jgi:hypothetical protein
MHVLIILIQNTSFVYLIPHLEVPYLDPSHQQ